MIAPLRSIKFWINAFIPRNISRLTKRVPKGKHSGKTMIPGPFPISDCFLTDQRSFSNHVHAKSRMHSELKLIVQGSNATFTQWHHCDLTCECDCEDGEPECEKKSSSTDMRFTLPSRIDVVQPMTVKLKGAANNPCHTGSPAIDYMGAITIDLAERSIEFNGKVDAFPAFEAYATINDGAGVTMFQILPKPGKTPWNLVGGPSESVKAKFKDRYFNGRFQKIY